MRLGERLRQHWPEYLIEAAALGLFMISAGVCTVLVEHPQSAVRAAVESDLLRRALLGVAMGGTSMAIVYSPWGKRSGAHMNPAVTFAFWRLGKVAGSDALFYIAAQMVGGIAGVVGVFSVLGDAFAAPPVTWVATLPGEAGAGVAFVAEAAISFVLLSTVLAVIARPKLASYSGVAAGVLVATFITFEAPLSGMSMNPARSFASAAPADLWLDLWIYFVAPTLGMWLAAVLHRRTSGASGHCAKLVHASDQRCIHCGYDPARVVDIQRKPWGEIGA